MSVDVAYNRLSSIADAVRKKTAETNLYLLSEIPGKIRSLNKNTNPVKLLGDVTGTSIVAKSYVSPTPGSEGERYGEFHIWVNPEAVISRIREYDGKTEYVFEAMADSSSSIRRRCKIYRDGAYITTIWWFYSGGVSNESPFGSNITVPDEYGNLIAVSFNDWEPPIGPIENALLVQDGDTVILDNPETLKIVKGRIQNGEARILQTPGIIVDEATRSAAEFGKYGIAVAATGSKKSSTASNDTINTGSIGYINIKMQKEPYSMLLTSIPVKVYDTAYSDSPYIKYILVEDQGYQDQIDAINANDCILEYTETSTF